MARDEIDNECKMTEPPINRDPDALDHEFRVRLAATLGQLAMEGLYFKFHEGFRTSVRQQWLYAQGRTRTGPRVTNLNGTTKLSNHQGDGSIGSGRAADCYPLTNGKVDVNPERRIWQRYAEVAEANGLTAGYRWVSPHDPPHVELRKKE
jgi:peptidoglycan L-alanyl-D-glutamate endopeptidase CwlK